MIGRRKLLESIDKALEVQRRLILHLNRHIASAVTHGSLGEKEKEAMLERFQAMVITHTKHSSTLESIREEILSGDINVY